MPSHIKPKLFKSEGTLFFSFLFYLGQMHLMFTCMLPHYVAFTVLLAVNSIQSFGGQLHSDKVCPFNGVTSSGSLEEGGRKHGLECTSRPDTLNSALVTSFKLHTARNTVYQAVSLTQSLTQSLAGQCLWGEPLMAPWSIFAKAQLTQWHLLTYTYSPRWISSSPAVAATTAPLHCNLKALAQPSITWKGVTGAVVSLLQQC